MNQINVLITSIRVVSWEMIGKYNRRETVPQIEAAKNIADALEVHLDYLMSVSSQTAFNKRTLDRIQDLEQLEENKKQTLYDLIDTYIRDAESPKGVQSINNPSQSDERLGYSVYLSIKAFNTSAFFQIYLSNK